MLKGWAVKGEDLVGKMCKVVSLVDMSGTDGESMLHLFAFFSSIKCNKCRIFLEELAINPSRDLTVLNKGDNMNKMHTEGMDGRTTVCCTGATNTSSPVLSDSSKVLVRDGVTAALVTDGNLQLSVLPRNKLLASVRLCHASKYLECVHMIARNALRLVCICFPEITVYGHRLTIHSLDMIPEGSWKDFYTTTPRSSRTLRKVMESKHTNFDSKKTQYYVNAHQSGPKQPDV